MLLAAWRSAIAKSKLANRHGPDDARLRQIDRARREFAQLKTDSEFDDDLRGFSHVVIAHAYERLFDEVASRHPREVELFSRSLRACISNTPGRQRRPNTASGRTMNRLRKMHAAFIQELERVQRGQALRRGSRLMEVLHAIDRCILPDSLRGHPRRGYNAHYARDIFDAVRKAVMDLHREMRVVILERHHKLKPETPLVTPAHWPQELARRLAPQFDDWERDPEYRPARRSQIQSRMWRDDVAERCLYRESPGRVWDDVVSADAAAGSFLEERFRIGSARVRRLLQATNRGV